MSDGTSHGGGHPFVRGPIASRVRIRRATVNDVGSLARHRAEMFRAMGQLAAAAYDPLMHEAERYFTLAIPTGEYVGWVAAPADEMDTVVAGAGVQLRPILPRPDHKGQLLVGQQGLVLNVFTEVPWRKRGIAEELMQHVMAWAREHRLASLVLHASAEGRHLYEKLGFAGTNEMQFMGDLR
jgi:GNAT superfamily N-acetyltransferase